MSIASDETADRIRAVIGHRPGMVEKKMFGGICFMLHGNMLCGSMKAGELLIRVGPGQHEAALARPGAEPMRMGERTMAGFISVAQDSIEDEEVIANWIAFAESYVKSLPPKDEPARKPAAGKSPARRRTSPATR